jgi:hypothetical protein
MMEFVITVYMDQSDVTNWIRSVTVSQLNAVDRKFTLVFNAWHSFGPSNRWDIFGSYDPANPRQEILIRNGIIPEDRPKTVSIAGGETAVMPTITAEGYEFVWMAKRRGPRDTIIMVPTWGNIVEDVTKAIEESRTEVAVYRVWPGCYSLHVAVKKLARAAGLNLSIRIPNYDMVPYVVPMKNSYWQEIMRLTDPFAPHRYYVRSTNTLVIADKQDAIMGAGNKLVIPGDVIKSLVARPTKKRRLRRVVATVPPWR